MSVFVSKQLKYFMVAMEKRSISKAAEELYLTRTPLSKKLADLENALNAQLFNRKYNELEPTDYALALYDELNPLYHAHLQLEKKLKDNDKDKVISVIFDISVPELLYRILSAAIQSEFHNKQIKFQRIIITDQLLEDNKNNRNAIFVSLRMITPLVSYKTLSWTGGEVALMHSKCLSHSDLLELHIWKDESSEFFKRKAETLLKERYESIHFIPHNMEFQSVMYRVHQGVGAFMMPLKCATMHKNENMIIEALSGRYTHIYMYHNVEEKTESTVQTVKNILNTLM